MTNEIMIKVLDTNSRATTGNRLAKITYRTDRKTGVKPPSKCGELAAISSKDITDNISNLMDSVIRLLESTQDDIIREQIELGATTVDISLINMASLSKYLSEKSKGERLTKAVLVDWFDIELEDLLVAAVSDKLGVSGDPTEKQDSLISDTIAQFKAYITGLASPRAFIQKDSRPAILKALSLVSDDMSKALTSKVGGMSENVMPTLAESL